jgi:hypothetical protein
MFVFLRQRNGSYPNFVAQKPTVAKVPAIAINLRYADYRCWQKEAPPRDALTGPKFREVSLKGGRVTGHR